MIVAEWLRFAPHPAHSSIVPSPTQSVALGAPTQSPILFTRNNDNDNNHANHLLLLLLFFSHSLLCAPHPPTMPTPSTKRVPPPCWTTDETLALINAYGARWLSLNRGNLRTSDWDAVSSAVSESTPGASKSSIQCRHKIEKLRKRYRSEKQRSLSFPGRFVSSWDLFPLLDSMNFGSSSAPGLGNQSRELVDQKVVDVTEFRVKTRNDKSLMSKYGNIDVDFNPDFALRSGLMGNYENIDFGDDFGGLDSRAKDYLKVNGDFGVGFGMKMEVDDTYFVTPQGFRLKSYENIDDGKSCPRLDFNHGVDGFPVRTFGDRISVPPPGFKAKNFVSVEANFKPNAYYDDHADYVVAKGSGSEFYAKSLGDGDFVPVGTRSKNYGRVNGNWNGTVDLRGMNVHDSSSRLRFGKKNGDGGVKRDLDPFEELVSSITLLTEKFVKVEKMKMEMARETQKMRMEMEKKHNQMILESQRHIFDSFVSGLLENKRKKKVKVYVASPKTT